MKKNTSKTRGWNLTFCTVVNFRFAIVPERNTRYQEFFGNVCRRLREAIFLTSSQLLVFQVINEAFQRRV